MSCHRRFIFSKYLFASRHVMTHDLMYHLETCLAQQLASIILTFALLLACHVKSFESFTLGHLFHFDFGGRISCILRVEECYAWTRSKCHRGCAAAIVCLTTKWSWQRRRDRKDFRLRFHSKQGCDRALTSICSNDPCWLSDAPEFTKLYTIISAAAESKGVHCSSWNTWKSWDRKREKYFCLAALWLWWWHWLEDWCSDAR